MNKRLKRYGGVGEGGLFSNVTVSDVVWGYQNNVADELSRRCNATLSNDTTYGLMYKVFTHTKIHCSSIFSRKKERLNDRLTD